MQAERRKYCTTGTNKYNKLYIKVLPLSGTRISTRSVTVKVNASGSLQQIYASRIPHLGLLTLTPHLRTFHYYC